MKVKIHTYALIIYINIQCIYIFKEINNYKCYIIWQRIVIYAVISDVDACDSVKVYIS